MYVLALALHYVLHRIILTKTLTTMMESQQTWKLSGVGWVMACHSLLQRVIIYFIVPKFRWNNF